MSIQFDALIDLSYGDCGKGATAYHLISDKKKGYNSCFRHNGSGNAGHTIYHNGKKIVTHMIPVGVVHGLKSYIGQGCVVNPEKLLEEIDYLEKEGIPASKLVKVAHNTHVITNNHVLEDSKDTKIGTTKQGNGPAYRDKYERTGQRMEDVNITEIKNMLFSVHDEFYKSHEEHTILFEGAQGFYLDIDFGDYPYVTSSHCGIGSIFNNGFNPKQLRTTYGVIKAYETYVGANKFEPENNAKFQKIRTVGQEFGATTGRPRQCNWLNINRLNKAIEISGVDKLIIRKKDILDTAGFWGAIYNKETLIFDSSEEFTSYVNSKIKLEPIKIHWSKNHLSL
jgi:adenylosuccinate synthase